MTHLRGHTLNQMVTQHSFIVIMMVDAHAYKTHQFD